MTACKYGPDCPPSTAHEACQKHYTRIRRTGTAELVPGRPRRSGPWEIERQAMRGKAREMYLDGATLAEIRAEFGGIAKATLFRWLRGLPRHAPVEPFADIDEIAVDLVARGQRLVPLTNPERLAAVRAMTAAGIDGATQARRLGVSESTAGHLRKQIASEGNPE